ncbi:MAG: hypothetical protein COU11_04100 [Candidatus Harrisonbacteria bacterium CG10_big_fil_rev_8_21_14_0_10_49_15]|uniref:Response regulatory domain-containing protein n=1 Tax=Candidatus Harrisonbacteria bacterium CG10_big_fil_rev_8_21_14_0_10_49_15 TaxID=1974587 RepID=A0A2H0ULK3_9BACT|nr:MAG: hypothetical protein COU11_04100 [Candidatus Harrisonbacteria bacterium CG10_big_fil_rev_8_21_14_0_10_49_15]
MAKPLILTVDDDKEYQDLLVDKLEAAGFTVVQASDGNEGVVIAQQRQPDLILMDVQMPNKNGVAAVTELQADGKTNNIRVVFLTQLGDPWSAAGEINRRFAREVGAVDYFRKGGEFEHLFEMINNILARKKLEPAE